MSADILGVLWVGGFAFLLVLGAVWTVRRIVPTTVNKPAPVVEPEVPRCPCNEPATRPVSRTHAGVTWTGAMRVRLGMAPVYTLSIPEEAPSVLCDVHGRVWDAKLRRRCAAVIAARRAEAEEAIAVEMAAIETETLFRELVESLTESQRKAGGRRPITSLVRVRNGTEGEP